MKQQTSGAGGGLPPTREDLVPVASIDTRGEPDHPQRASINLARGTIFAENLEPLQRYVRAVNLRIPPTLPEDIVDGIASTALWKRLCEKHLPERKTLGHIRNVFKRDAIHDLRDEKRKRRRRARPEHWQGLTVSGRMNRNTREGEAEADLQRAAADALGLELREAAFVDLLVEMDASQTPFLEALRGHLVDREDLKGEERDAVARRFGLEPKIVTSRKNKAAQLFLEHWRRHFDALSEDEKALLKGDAARRKA